MTHPIYSSSALAQLSASQLKQIASDLGAAPTGDERDFWLNCILAHQSGIIQAFNTVPASLIEEKTLELLGVLVVDRQDESDFVVPHGDIRFWVHRFDELIGTISTWVIGGEILIIPQNTAIPINLLGVIVSSMQSVTYCQNKS